MVSACFDIKRLPVLAILLGANALTSPLLRR